MFRGPQQTLSAQLAVNMRIKVLHHAPANHLPTRAGDPTPVSRNLDPLAHPFARARERTRALNAAKIERMFAKPFIASLEGHIDSINAVVREPSSLSTIASASADGEIILHDLPQRRNILKLPGAHKRSVTGICFAGPNKLLSCGVDQNVRLWDVQASSYEHGTEVDEDGEGNVQVHRPIMVYPGRAAFNAVDHHKTDPLFATASNTVQLWDETKTSPVMNLTFPTSTETVTALKFNQSETSVLASTGSDRSFTLYDVRTGKAERRLIFQMRANALSWCPTLPTCILLASEDHNLYTFDVRSLASPTQIYKGHVAAAMSCDWSPTGTELVSGSWDRTLRIWKAGEGRGSEAYHTKRMQRVFSTVYTGDARFVLSGSDDGNVRIWKAHASDRLGIVAGRERAAREYRAKLREKWKYDPEVGKIERRRHLPKAIYSTSKLKQTMLDSRNTKEERRRQHSRAGETKPKAERKNFVIAEQT